MKKIIMLVILLMGIEVCNINAGKPDYYLSEGDIANEFEIYEEYNPYIHKYYFNFGCTFNSHREVIEGTPTEFINTYEVGSYYINVDVSFYNVCTNEYNTITKQILIRVRDTTAPTINGVKNHVLEYGAKLPDFSEGIEYYDNYSFKSDIDFIINTSNININKLGQYPIYYTAADEFGNITTVTSMVTIVDTNAPSLSTPKSITVNVNDYTYDFRNDATANDVYEGDISSRIEIDYRDLDITKLGVYQIEYKVSDINGNETSAFTTVNVIDSEKPVINNVKPITIDYGTDINTVDFTKNISVTDNYYKELELNCDASKVDTNRIGDYVIAYYTVDGSGNLAAAYTTVHVVDNISPVLEVINNNVTISIGDSDYDFTQHFSFSDNYFEEPTLQIDTHRVNFNFPGFYTVTATVTDYSGNISQATLNVFVEGSSNISDTTDNVDGTSDNIEVESDEYESKDISKIVKPVLILSIPVAGFVLAKSYILKGQ